MILLLGGDAYSPFRLDALKDAIAKAEPSLGPIDIDAKWVYALQMSDRAFEVEELRRAATLLNAVGDCDGADFYVTPRKGTISPWSSKATDIFRNCGLKSILRVERGIRFKVEKLGSGEVEKWRGGEVEKWGSGEVEKWRGGEVETTSRLHDSTASLLHPTTLSLLHDRMTEGVYTDISDLFDVAAPRPGRVYDVLARGVEAIREANDEMGLAISEVEMKYLAKSFKHAKRNPTDTELTMFGQVNSEHCRHKIFGAEFIIDGKKQPHSLFEMIKNTHKKRPQDTLSAYKDNSSVVKGFKTEVFAIDPATNRYSFKKDQLDQLMKVETHNHPTAISPFPGAATGVGGEIRDEAATGTGSRTVAGICGFMVSNLRIPGFPQPWEREFASFPTRLATPLQIMVDGPIGGAAFGNEFGRPQLCGFFRTYEGEIAGELRGYHKPIMLAGGMGVIRESQVQKKDVTVGALIVQIGGPAMRIGLGGGAASSMMTGTNSEALDFNSVQRGNAEMQRRCQGVIDACSYLGKANPILSVHDIGAGGLSNGCPELVEATGGRFELREVHNEERSMNPMEIWCCEAQERYVLALKPEARFFFEQLCERERCPVAFIGIATGDGQLVLEDSHFGDRPIDMDIKVLLGKPPRMVRKVKRVAKKHAPTNFEGVKPIDALARILHLPAVADKTFLITITDRTVTGRVARDQMVGKYQLPAADCAVTMMGYRTFEGQAMATGERTPIAMLDGPASGRMAITEAITNLAAADVGDISQIRLSANWMAPCGDPGEDAILYDTVEEVGLRFCPKLGVSIPVGKDSCSMHTVWQEKDGTDRKQVAPLSLVVSSFAPVKDARLTLTPDLKPDEKVKVKGEGEERSSVSFLIYVDLSPRGRGGDAASTRDRLPLGATALAQVYGQLGDTHADADADLLKRFFNAMQKIVRGKLALAYHDRSDGGLAVTLAEMAITGGRGVLAKLPEGDALEQLYNEQPGAVLQVSERNRAKVLKIFAAAKVPAQLIGTCTQSSRDFKIWVGERLAISTDITWLRRQWSETTYRMQAIRDNPVCARQEYDNGLDERDPGLNYHLTFDPDGKVEKWGSGEVEKWSCGEVEKWSCGEVEKWSCGEVEKCSCGEVEKCSCGEVEKWSCGEVEKCSCGEVEKWGSGEVEKWRSGEVEKWRSGEVEKCSCGEVERCDSTTSPLHHSTTPPLHHSTLPPRMAILREQGVNGHIEMAAAFALAGFDCTDVHMSDLISGKVDLADFQGLVACGGFSYGDVLGAGSGWARSILFNDRLREMFKMFFERPDTFSLGVCNGCQMLSQLKDIIPGAAKWPKFVKNISEQFEARLCTIEIEESPSIFFKGMAGSRLPIAVAHGEGRVWTDGFAPTICAAHFVDNYGRATTRYPYNPNGSIGGQTAFTSADGRATIMMPHPERGFRAAQLSYNDGTFREDGPWMRMFRNAYAFATSVRKA